MYVRTSGQVVCQIDNKTFPHDGTPRGESRAVADCKLHASALMRDLGASDVNSARVEFKRRNVPPVDQPINPTDRHLFFHGWGYESLLDGVKFTIPQPGNPDSQYETLLRAREYVKSKLGEK